MKAKFVVAAIAALFLCAYVANAQEQKKPDIMELCEQEADRLESLLDLEAWQTFRVDSTLKHDYPAMNAEIEELRNAKMANVDIYQQVQDKWLDKIDASYKKIFTEEQWAIYLKNGAARLQKAREKRRVKLAQSSAPKTKKK